MGSNPSEFKGSDDLPMEHLSWMDALEFCNALSQKRASGRSTRSRPSAKSSLERPGLPVPHRGRVGIRLPRKRAPPTPTPSRTIRNTSANMAGSTVPHRPTGRPEEAERLRAVRHARQRLGVVLGLVRRGLQQSVTRGRPDRTPERPRAGCTAAGAGATTRATSGRHAAPGFVPGSPSPLPGLPPGPRSVWTLSSGGQGASGAGSRSTGWRHGGAVGRSPAGRGRSEPAGGGSWEARTLGPTGSRS